jgi:calcineurin-like phosphoesterase family protein
MKDYFYKPVKISSTDHNVLFWGCMHYGHDPKWDEPIWKTRGYNSSREHDEGLIDNWNKKANKDTIGFLLGDTIFGHMADERLMELFRRLEFKVLYVLPGNHQAGYKQLLEKSENNTLYMSNFWDHNDQREIIFVPNYIETIVNGQAIVMSHYPILSWNGAGKGAYHIFAHVHNNLNRSEIGRLYLKTGLNYEVSVENCPSPITFGELRAEMRKKTQSTPDHHNDT